MRKTISKKKSLPRIYNKDLVEFMKKVYSIKEAQLEVPTVTIGEFFLKLLHAATNGHILHLQTKSYSEHKALQKYYEELPDTPVGIIGKIGDSPIHDLVHRTTPQTKPLHEDIVYGLCYKYGIEKGDVLDFARAIEERHGIK